VLGQVGVPVKLFAEVVVDGCLVLVLPHPSGISHFWNVRALEPYLTLNPT
jgi:hypothetical protein